MDINAVLSKGMNFIMQGARPFQIKLINYYVSGINYDDDLTQVCIGSYYTSGLMFCLNNEKGSIDALLIEQGKLLTNDSKLYIGSSQIDSSGILIGVGSPTSSEWFTVIPIGIHDNEGSGGQNIFTELYIRRTLTGSLW
jgi:hypothetical protein